MWTRQTLLELVRLRCADCRFLIVSNREPYIHQYNAGAIDCVQPASGLATALEPVMRACGGCWIAHGSGSADRASVDANNHVQVPPDNPAYRLRRVWLTAEQEARYYDGTSNQALWPLCHVAFTRPVFRPEDWQGYREVNEIFARAVLEEAGDGPTFVFVQDYHLALVPKLVKDRNPNIITAHFWHIPWPNPEVFRSFPWKDEILDGLLGNDLLGFHLRNDCQNFLDTVDRTLEARIDREASEVIRRGRRTAVRAFPISIDFEEHQAGVAADWAGDQTRQWLRELGGAHQFLGIGIDRMDYTKGILERLQAVDRFLARYPGYLGKLTFLQIAVPSRGAISEYRTLENELDRKVREINRRWAFGSWRPVVFLKRHVPRWKLPALHRLADFCMVTSLHDGMNLVAKEFVASRSDNSGVLILSEFAGSSRELSDALLVNPFDEEQQAEAIRQAIEMPEEERRRRMLRMRGILEENNVYRWAGKIVSTLLRYEFSPTPGGDGAAAFNAASGSALC